MHANRMMVLVGVVGGVVSWASGCALDEVEEGSSGGEISAAIHGLRCESLYCDCVDSWKWSEQSCRDTYCEGGKEYHGGDAECAATAIDDPKKKCDAKYCSCIRKGRRPKMCRTNYCEGGKFYKGGDVQCFDHGPAVGDPLPCTPRIVPTAWKNGNRLQSTSSWRNGHLALANDNQFTTFSVRKSCDNGERELVGPVTRISNHLDVRGFDLKAPPEIGPEATLTGIEARVKQRGGTFTEAIIYTGLGGSHNLIGQRRVVNGFHHFGSGRSLFGKPLKAHHTNNGFHWGLTMRTRVTAPRDYCPIAASSEVDVIQLRAHYEVCEENPDIPMYQDVP